MTSPQFKRILEFELPYMRGRDVLAVQRRLRAQAGPADGVFGPATDRAVRGWQRSKGLKVDGAVGHDTWNSMFPELVQAAAQAAERVHYLPPRDASIGDMPVTRAQAERVKDWLMMNFGDAVQLAIAGTPIDADLVCAMVCKETANIWLDKVASIPAASLLPLCVFDASGDFPGTQRNAFPQNAEALRQDNRFPGLADMLIAEANQMRKILKGWGPAPYLYKGYGLLQYDLQNVVGDPDFFTNKLWYSFDGCIDRYMREMREKLRNTASLADAVRAYNGSGPKAEEYSAQVMLIRTWCAAHTTPN